MSHPVLLKQNVKTSLTELQLTIIQSEQSLVATAYVNNKKIYTQKNELQDKKASKGDIHELKKYAIQQLERDEKVIRKIKLTLLQKKSSNIFRNNFKPNASCSSLGQADINNTQYKIAGRLISRRIMGRASFANIQDGSGSIQIYLSSDTLSKEEYQKFKLSDVGDIVGVTGHVFRTKRNELALNTVSIELLTKSLLPLPDKFHHLKDTEQRYRQRYLDLISNEESKQVFYQRSKIIQLIRNFFIEKSFLEVETPMMQSIPGGASAKPFITHHNALNTDLYLRVSPELYLKRLIVGGFERVFEINRNFRNEGLSTKHNPEFTMIEFYQAYATYHDLMPLTEELFKELSKKILNEKPINFGKDDIYLNRPFHRFTMKEAISKFNETPDCHDAINSKETALVYAQQLGVKLDNNLSLGKIINEIFEQTVEDRLIQPTFITEYPIEVSPLARRSDKDSSVTDRFELFIAGREIANGFSELNDAEDQAQRFEQQVKERNSGDDEAMFYDKDYVTALKHGMPPTAGEGIGIDRLVMLLTNCSSIKNVILFPQLRREPTNG